MQRTDGASEDRLPEGTASVSLEEKELLPHVARAATCVLRAKTAEAALLGPERERIVADTVSAVQGSEARAIMADALAAREGSDERGIKRPVAIEDVRRDLKGPEAEALSAQNIGALLGVPVLGSDGQLLGTLTVADQAPRKWTQAEIDTLQGMAPIVAAIALRCGGELDQALARLRRSFDDGLAGHAVAASDGRILACNPEFARIGGFSSVEEAMQVNLRSLEREPGSFNACLTRLKDSPIIPLEEISFIRHDGKPSQVLARFAATLDAAGNVVEVRVYLLDITERFRLEQGLRETADRMHLVELATQDVFWDWNLATGKLSWNSSIARRFRYTPNEVRPSIDWHVERIHADDRERVLRGVERTILGVETSWSDEYRFLRGDGTYATVLDRAHIVRNSRGEPIRVVGWILDITELKASEETQRFFARASAALDSVLEVDGTAITLANLGVPELADFCLVDLLEVDGSLHRRAVAHADARAEQHLGLGATFPPGSDDGSAPLTVARTGSPVFLAHDANSQKLGIAEGAEMRSYLIVPIAGRERIVGAVTFGFTNARRHFDPVELMTAKELARRAGKAIDNAVLYETARNAVKVRNEVLGVVSHDLRSPVNTMMATLSALSDIVRKDRPEVRHWFDVLCQSISQMRGLIEDLLDASRIESDQFTLDIAEADPVHIIEEARDMMRAAAADKGIEIETHLPEDLPPIAVDAHKMVRVMGNLIENAIKFSHPGGVVDVRAELDGDELFVSVSDNGAGIPADQISRVFERFWAEKKTDRSGSGLGLTIAKGIVEAHGGRIWVRSAEDEGSTFTFTLPLSVKPEQTVIRLPQKSRGGAAIG